MQTGNEDIRKLKQNEVPLPIDKKLTKPEFFKLCRTRFISLNSSELIGILNQMKLEGKIDENNLTVLDVEIVSEELFGGWM